MPCSQKWLKNTARRKRLTLRGGIGGLRGADWRGFGTWDTDRYAVYHPGCPPVVVPGVYRSQVRLDNGRYTPYNIVGGVPCVLVRTEDGVVCVPGHEPYPRLARGLSYPMRRAFPVKRDQAPVTAIAPRSPEGVGRRGNAGRKQRRLPALRKESGPPRNRIGIGAPSSPCGRACDDTIGTDPNLTGCAPGMAPTGVYWDFQRHYRRWPRRGRRGPYPLPQQPYIIGRHASFYYAHHQPCPTRANYYLVDSD